MSAKQKILYVPSVLQEVGLRQLAGFRRFAGSVGWDVVALETEDAPAGVVRDALRRVRPAGCAAVMSQDRKDIPPRFFGKVPVVYIHLPDNCLHWRAHAMSIDDEAVARMAFHDLAAGLPDAYAFVGDRHDFRWSRVRGRVFRSLVAATGRRFFEFEVRPGEEAGPFAARLAAFARRLPKKCAVFAATDFEAREFLAACRAERRAVPREFTVLGVDNREELCQSLSPPVSSIDVDWERTGFIAARMLAGVMESPDVWPPRRETCTPLMVVRRASTGGKGRHEPRIAEAVAMIRSEACDGLTAAALAARFPGSRRLFDMRFREAVGHSPLDEIIHVRLERAFALLAMTDTAIGAIPHFCGFRTYAALDAVFRRRFGIPMSEWRARNSR